MATQEDDNLPRIPDGVYAPSVLRAGHLGGAEAAEIDLSPRCSYRLFVVEDGTAVLRRPGMTETFRPGHCFLIPPGPWRLSMSPGSRVLHAVFDVVHAQRTRREPGNWVHAPPADPQPQPEQIWGLSLPVRLPERFEPLAIACLTIIRMHYWRNPPGQALACGHLARFLGELVAWVHQQTQPESDRSAEADTLVMDALDLLEDPQAHPVKLGEAAMLLGVSRGYLSRQIRRQTGHSPRQLIERRKSHTAAHLLATTDHPLRKVAAMLGYRHVSSFVRAFRSWFGLTPSVYRRQRRRDGRGS